MNSVGKDIFRSIHEGKWLYVEYQNSDEERTKYWISINNIKRAVQTSHLFEKLPSDCEFFFKASIDFVIYKKGYRNKEFPVLAIELDGPEHHTDPKVMVRDEKKKQICKDHGFTLIHVDNTYARRYNFLKDILTEFFNGK